MKQAAYLKRRTKIVCTIGPATGTTSAIERLITAGMNVARLNLSHGSFRTHTRYVRNIRRVSKNLGIPVAILIDLPGQKYRTGRLKGGSTILEKEARVTLTTGDFEGNAASIPIDLPNLAQKVKTGDTVLLDDGAIELRVLGKKDNEVTCRVTSGGVLTERRGLVVPGMDSPELYISETMRNHVLFAIEQKPDYLALSFVSRYEDVTAVRTLLKDNNQNIPIISKIERVQAVKKFDDILSVSDGVMVARGDLGVDITLEKIPMIQKEIIEKCNRAGKPAITATQMLESMVNSRRPTRAEVTDVANAIFDGTDATMLSEETSIGKHPVQSVRMMARIALETERGLAYEDMLTERGKWLRRETDEVISYNACHTAQSLGAAAIVAFTQSGSTAKRVSKYRPRVPIIALTPSDIISGRLLLHWGVYPFRIKAASSVDDFFATAARLAKEIGAAKKDDSIIITGGVPIGVTGSTNLLKVEKVN